MNLASRNSMIVAEVCAGSPAATGRGWAVSQKRELEQTEMKA